MTMRKIAIGGIGLILLAIAGYFVHRQIYRLLFPYLDQKIADSLMVTPEWIEISPQHPLVAEREIQQVILYVEAPVKPSSELSGCLLPDGSVVMPEVQLVAQDGKVYKLTEYSESIYPKRHEYFLSEFENKKDLPKTKRYGTVRVRCEKPLKVMKVVWRCYNQGDIL